MSRKYERKYRKEKGATSEHVARHKVPAKWLSKFKKRGNDHMKNYRLGSKKRNGLDTRMDNMTERRVLYTRGLSGDVYIPPSVYTTRIKQQVESMKLMKNPSKRQIRNLYIAAKKLNMNLSIFNEWSFDRRTKTLEMSKQTKQSYKKKK